MLWPSQSFTFLAFGNALQMRLWCWTLNPSHPPSRCYCPSLPLSRSLLHTHTHTHTHTITLTHIHSLTHSLTHSPTHSHLHSLQKRLWSWAATRSAVRAPCWIRSARVAGQSNPVTLTLTLNLAPIVTLAPTVTLTTSTPTVNLTLRLTRPVPQLVQCQDSPRPWS